MSDNTTLDEFWEFVLKCLEDVKKTTKKNYETPNLSRDGTGRSNTVIQQESMLTMVRLQ